MIMISSSTFYTYMYEKFFLVRCGDWSLVPIWIHFPGCKKPVKYPDIFLLQM